MDRPATAASPSRRAQALGEVAGDLRHWRRVATAAGSTAEDIRVDAGGRLDAAAAAVASAVSTADVGQASVAEVVGEMDRLRREAEEAESSVAFRSDRIEESTQYVERTVARGRDGGGRPLQLAEFGNGAAGQAACRLGGCLAPCRALTERVRSAAVTDDAWLWSAAEQAAVARARQAWARGSSHLTALLASVRVHVARDEAERRTERSVGRLAGQEEALRRYDQPAYQAP
ncbi:MAG: hypothetical protein M3Y91_05675 [Actinomycetota bacterium]|nr:hypothetical protein [Actinomycetota bacterium]